MARVFRLPDRSRMFWQQYSRELEKQGLQSLPIVIVISLFIGAILTIQAKTNTENPFLPKYIVGLLTRETLLLEFSSTILCLILAGKVGSNIHMTTPFCYYAHNKKSIAKIQKKLAFF